MPLDAHLPKTGTGRPRRGPRLFFKLLLFILLIAVVPLTALCIMLNVKMEQIIRSELERSYQQVVGQHMLNLEHKLETYQRLAALIASNASVLDVLKPQAPEPSTLYELGRQASEEIGKLVTSYNAPEGRSVIVYYYQDDYPIYGRNFTSSKSAAHESWYPTATGSQSASFYYEPTNTDSKIISFTVRINDSSIDSFGKKLGFVKADIDAKRFFESAAGPFDRSQSEECYLLDRSGNTLISSVVGETLELDDTDLSGLIEADRTEPVLAYRDGERVLVFAHSLPSSGLAAAFVYRYGETQRRVQEVTRLVTIATVISILAAMALAVGFSRHFTHRLYSLAEKMERVAVGDMTANEAALGNDEITEVEERFNQMVRQVNQLIQTNYIQELEHKEAELKTLQLQITPHFLYNTLETLNSIGAINHCREVCEISQRLGDMLRYSINTDSTEFVPLERELQHIENYVYIQKLRFREMFEVFVNVDDSLKKVPILRFLLQPVVENAILHGFRDANRKGCIEISARAEGQRLLLNVSDDGQGIAPDQVASLNEYLNREAVDEQMKYHKSIGIRNVNMRIKLTCGQGYGIRIESRPEQGTDVIYTLPLRGVR